jgi:hypothetical protein
MASLSHTPYETCTLVEGGLHGPRQLILKRFKLPFIKDQQCEFWFNELSKSGAIGSRARARNNRRMTINDGNDRVRRSRRCTVHMQSYVYATARGRRTRDGQWSTSESTIGGGGATVVICGFVDSLPPNYYYNNIHYNNMGRPCVESLVVCRSQRCSMSMIRRDTGC